jgi:hypothetical protein
MLEFFAVAAVAEHLKNKKEKEDKNLSEYFDGDQDRKVTLVIKKQPMNMNAVNLVAGVIALIIAILTARLAYDCNSRSDPALQIIAMLFGFFFSGIYLVYYFLRYILLGGSCGGGKGRKRVRRRKRRKR